MPQGSSLLGGGFVTPVGMSGSAGGGVQMKVLQLQEGLLLLQPQLEMLLLLGQRLLVLLGEFQCPVG
jgi:hypothetical protein